MNRIGSRKAYGARLQREACGFTAVELLISMAVLAILLAIGVPALRDVITSQHVRSAANDLYTDFAYARAEAIKRNAQVRVVRDAAAWSGGWTVIVGTTTLKTQPPIANVSFGGTSVDSVTYNGDGRATLANTSSFNFSSAHGGAVSMRCVVVTPSGRPAILTDSNRNGSCQDG